MLIQPKLGHYLLIACAILIELEKPQLSSFNCSLPFMSHTDGPQFFVQESGTTSTFREAFFIPQLLEDAQAMPFMMV